MDIVSLLTQQHEKVKSLFRAIEAAPDRESAESLLVEIIDALQLHATIEERIFYPELRKAMGEDEPVDHALEEHAEVKNLIEQIFADPPEPELRTIVKTLIAAVEQHVMEEETELFPAAKESMNRRRMQEEAKRARQIESQLNNGDAAPT